MCVGENMLKAVIFDLDGTLLPMNEEEFTRGYFGLLYRKVAPYGYEKDEFIKTIWKGTNLMKLNDGKITNEETFWKCFAEVYGKEKLNDKALFDEFYREDFPNAKAFCGFEMYADKIVKHCKEKVGRVILASNPVFPREAMIWRTKFAGVDDSLFDYISDYSNSSACKPNPKFLQEILDKNNLQADEVIYIGNSEIEDGRMCDALGVKCYMIGDNVVIDEERAKRIEKIKYEDVYTMF